MGSLKSSGIGFWARFREIVLAGQTDVEIKLDRFYSAGRVWGKSTLTSKVLSEILLRAAKESRRLQKQK